MHDRTSTLMASAIETNKSQRSGHVARRLFFFLIAAFALAFATERGRSTELPTFAPNLSRGINLAHWYAQAPNGLTDKHLTTFITQSDIQRLAKAGFAHVRLPIEMSPAFGADEPSRRVRELYIESIATLIAGGLAVVVDLHPTEADKRVIQAKPRVLVEGWAHFAAALSRFPPEKLAFEVMNEPHPMRGRQWHELQAEAVKSIRAAAPAHTIVVNPGNWSGIGEFADFPALDDRNLVYTAHVYDPLLFTHQGATWAWDVAASISDLPWPLAPATADAAATAATKAGRPLAILKDQISRGLFDLQATEVNLDQLVAWQRRSGNVFIWIGEFGAYRRFAPRESRLQWHQAYRSAFEARGWGWALWDYLGDFGIVLHANGRTYDGELLDRLGLKK